MANKGDRSPTKACSKTAGKITGVGMPAHIDCTAIGILQSPTGCNSDKSLCCCKKNKCNSASGVSILLPIVTLGVAKVFLCNKVLVYCLTRSRRSNSKRLQDNCIILSDSRPHFAAL